MSDEPFLLPFYSFFISRLILEIVNGYLLWQGDKKSQPSRLRPPSYLLSLVLLHNWVLMLASIVNTLCIRRRGVHRFTTCVWRNAQSCLSGDSQTNVPLTLHSEILRRALFPPIKAIILFLHREFCIGLTVIRTDKECQWRTS